MFFDRTKKQQTINKGGIETFDSLLLQKTELELRLAELEKLIVNVSDVKKEDEEEDELEAYLSQISNQQTVIDLKRYSAEAEEAKTALTRVLSLIAIAKPHDYTDPIVVTAKQELPPRTTKVIDDNPSANRAAVKKEEESKKPKPKLEQLEEEVEEWLPSDTTQTDLKSQYGY